jgi:cytochrome c-type biogenesis protein CcmH
MIPAMADTTTSPAQRRFAPATLVLIAAALLAAAAVVIAIVRSGGTSEAPATNTMAAANGAPGDDVHNFVSGLRERVRRNPEDDDGWYQLGLAYREIGQYAEAEQAFRRAMQLRPRNADYLAYLGEALVLRGGGPTPPAEAQHLFRRALEIDPDNAQSRYYLAVIKDINGDHRAAIDELLALLRSAPANAAWYDQVRDAVRNIAEHNRIDIADRLPPPRAPRQPPQSVATAAIPGPTPEQLRAASSIPPSQQDEMVRGMVDRLAARLRQNPRDADGWIRLMRSRMVLNDARGARQALDSGLAAFNGDAATQQRLRAAAGELGIPTA